MALEDNVALTDKEKEWATRASRFVKAELKRAGLGYKELAEKLNAHGLEETKDSIAAKLVRGTFPVTFFLAVLTALELEGVTLAEL